MDLITYPDALGGNLKSLQKILDSSFSGIFTGLHILPPYPSSGDRGFAPINYKKIDPRFGDWGDIRSLAQNYEITLDLMVNHVSAKSKMFQDYLKRGDDSVFKNFFLEVKDIWPAGSVPSDDMKKLVLRRPEPWSEFIVCNEAKQIWTTFGKENPSEQIDLNVHDEGVKEYFHDLFGFFASQHIKSIRLDAIAYVIKKAGTSCFFVEPDIYEFMNRIEDEAEQHGITALHEIHADFTVLEKIQEKNYRHYDFLLPYAVLEAVLTEDGTLYKKLLKDRPGDSVTLIDCHDGIPVQPDLNGLLEESSLRKVLSMTASRGARCTKLHAKEKYYADAPDVHQICGTLYSLLGEDDDAQVLARALQVFIPGHPQIDYEGLLCGLNDEAAYEADHDPRSLNRRNYTEEAVIKACQKPVVKRLLRMLRFAAEEDFRSGVFSLLNTDYQSISWNWRSGQYNYLF